MQFGVRGEDLGIGAALRLGHREARDDLIGEQRFEIALLLLGRAVLGENLTVAGIRRLAAENGRRETRAAEDLVHQRELDLAVSLAAEFGLEMARPQLVLADLGLQRAHQLVAIGVADIVRRLQHVIERLDLFAHEFIDPVEFLLKLRFGFKIPAHDCSSMEMVGGGVRARRASLWSFIAPLALPIARLPQAVVFLKG